MKKSKAICVLAIVGLLSSNLGGCTVGNTQIRLETIQLHSHKTVFQINNNKCELKYECKGESDLDDDSNDLEELAKLEEDLSNIKNERK